MKKFHNVKENDEQSKHTVEDVSEMDEFAKEVLKCIEGMPVHEVSQLL